MATSFRAVYQGAAFRADLSVNGVGPHSSERVTDSEWRTLLNASVKSAWRMAASARPDFQVKSADTTVVSGGSASILLTTVAPDFFDLVDVVFSPDTLSEYSLGPFAWQNRRSPGGWFPANFGGSANLGGSSARLMGNSIYIEPSLRAGGPYRVWYCPMPKLIRADLTAALTATVALPSNTALGSGFSHQLTAVANGALVIDGITPAQGAIVLLTAELGGFNNGPYSVIQVGNGGLPFILQRSSISMVTNSLGTMVYTTGGTANVDLFFETTSLTATIDSQPWTWTEAFIEPQLEQFSELLELMTAIPPMQRDDDLDPKPLMLRAYGPAGADGGLAGELKSYFGRVRTANAPSRMVDTDRMGPRGPWSL